VSTVPEEGSDLGRAYLLGYAAGREFQRKVLPTEEELAQAVATTRVRAVGEEVLYAAADGTMLLYDGPDDGDGEPRLIARAVLAWLTTHHNEGTAS
jgi:hypothetical protein